MLRVNFLYLIITFFVFFSCNPKIKEAKTRKKYGNKFNIINPFYIDKITHLTNYSINPWFEEKIKKYHFKTIEIRYYDNLYSNLFVENQIFKFNKLGLLENYSYLATKDTLKLIDDLEYSYINNNLNKIYINKYALITNQAPITILKTNEYECFIKERNKDKKDSIFYYPNSKNPEIIKEKIGDFINYLEIFASKNITSSTFLNKVKSLDSTLLSFDIAEKIITYKDKQIPLESYQLDKNWNILEKCKEWQYNNLNQPILFMEWHNGKKSKHIELFYNENNLLKKYVFNKRKYILKYKTK